MRTTRLALLAGTASIVLAGYGCIAQAGETLPQASASPMASPVASPVASPAASHVMTLRLPDGQIEQVRYTGNVPPTVIVAPDAIAASAVAGDPFTMLDRISARMDRQAEILFREIDAMAPGQFGGFATIPAAAAPGVCMQSVQISFDGRGAAPHVVSHSSGNCGLGAAPAAPVAVPPIPWANPAPRVIEANAHRPTPRLLRVASEQRR